jgi:hypothetical protein
MAKLSFDQETLDQLAVIFDHEQESANYVQSPDGKGWLQKAALSSRVENDCMELIETFGNSRGFVVALVSYLAENKLIKSAPVADDDTELSFMDRLEGAAL